MTIRIKTKDLIYPVFVVEGKRQQQRIASFPGIYRFSVDRIVQEVEQVERLGITSVLLFGVPSTKDAQASKAFDTQGVVSLAVQAIKQRFSHMTVMTDVCLCAYTTHGHCGVIASPKRQGTTSPVKIDNDKTLAALSRMALIHAQAGADWVAPSAMAKRQVAAIRNILDTNGFTKTKIMGYSAKFASNFYGPFRHAADSAPQYGDRKGYQLDYAQSAQALQEIKDDIDEGADMVMVKPALSYLDIIAKAKARARFPLATYNVSAEYALVKHGAKQGLWDERAMVFEIITAMKRAGADRIITYHAKDIALWLKA
ncbi:MAG: porphobilinogen synthase [Candidatus Omnitrophica bacterium]|nr:porphobilinogen synthase [Candidatus Omnitrophota bacterium]